MSEEDCAVTESMCKEVGRDHKEAWTCLEEFYFVMVKAEVEVARLLFGLKGSGQRVAIVRRRQRGLSRVRRGPRQNKESVALGQSLTD